MNINDEIRNKLTIVDEIFLAKYLCFVETNKCTDGEYSEKHHILPKHIWPEYENFNQHPWNMVTLSLHDHYLLIIISLWQLILCGTQYQQSHTSPRMDHET